MQKLFIANWKMNYTVADSIQVANPLAEFLSKYNNEDLEVIICPPFMAIPYCFQLLKPFAKIGAQNISHLNDSKGAFTGEVSVNMISDYADFTIIGHSERRKLLKETNEMIAIKAKFAIKHEITPIICVGEDEEQRKSGKHIAFILNQLQQSLGTQCDPSKIIVAYEPVWAIGSGKPCNIDQVVEISARIKESIGEDVSVVYGGSVDKKNVDQFFRVAEINGVLVGSASLDVEKFIQMLKKISGAN